MVRPDGGIVWLQDDAVLLRDERGDPLYWQGVRFDITARKEAEEHLREAERRYRTLVEQIPAITYIDECRDVRRSTVVADDLHQPAGRDDPRVLARGVAATIPTLWAESDPPGRSSSARGRRIAATTRPASRSPWRSG